jgi:protein-L-isoaspartate(D-aspartate) O-methyltransferase
MDAIAAAFQAMPREGFVPATQRAAAGLDMPLPIGYEQTNSQPATVRLMLEWLNVQPGQDVLDVGSGSGWTTALLAILTGPAGQVYAVELVPALLEFGRANCERAGLTNAIFFGAGPVLGLPEHAPYDRILVSAAARSLPPTLLDQLKPGGRMVIPVGDEIRVITKSDRGRIQTMAYPGFAFVPLIQRPMPYRDYGSSTS